MGKFLDKFKKYTSDEDFDEDFFDEDYEDDDEVDSDEDEDIEADIDEAFEELEDIEEDETNECEDDAENFEDIDGVEPLSDDETVEAANDEEVFEELDPDDDEDDEDDEDGMDDEDIEDVEDDVDDEDTEDVEDAIDIEDTEAGDFTDAHDYDADSSDDIVEADSDEEDSDEAELDEGVSDAGFSEEVPAKPVQRKSSKPSPAEMIAAYYSEDQVPEKSKKKKKVYEDEEDDAIIRRQERHKRRVRNQILAYVFALLVLIGIIAGGYLGIRALVHKFKPVEAAATETTTVEDAIAELNESEEEIVIEAPEVMEEAEIAPTEEDYLGEIVDACISAMPIEDKVAQMFIVTPEQLTGASKVTQAGEKTQEMLKQYPVGGFVYFGDNLVDKEQTMNMISTTAGFNLYDMFFAINEEGGKSSLVANSKIEVEQVDEMADIGASNDSSKAYEVGKTIGQYLRELGFNVDLAPVADVVTVAEKSPIGERSFGSDAALVGMMAQKCAEGIQENGVSACLKHFPGLGDTTTDTHEERTVIDKSLVDLQATNFVAFKESIDAGVDFVMVSHATATGIDEVYPCSLSKDVIKGQLRDYLGYDGIVITDAMNMKAITDYYTTEEACVKAIKAGADIILMPDNFETAYNAVLDAVKEGSISEDRIDESLRRIFRVKKRDEITY